MPDALEQTFLNERPRLFQIAYRMMGSVSDAEDALQDVFLKLRAANPQGVASEQGYLTQAVVRRCLDEWKSARRKREHYVGPWLPEPLTAAGREDPAERGELADSVSLAFLILLESLNPVERAVFLLHDVFQYTFDEIAPTVEKSPAACRQLAHRAREKVRANRPRYSASPDQHRALVSRFMQAAQHGDLAALETILADDVTVYSDGGGLTPAARVPVVGIERVLRFILGLRTKAQRFGLVVEMRACEVNGAPAILQLVDGRLRAAVSVETDGGRIRRIYSVLNPQKLAPLASAEHLEGV